MQSSRTRKYLAGLLTGYVVTFVTVAVGLWMTPFTLRFLDREEYAIFILSGNILLWFFMLDLGASAALRAQVAQLTGRPDQERLNRLASTAFFMQLGVLILVAIAGAVIIQEFPSFFKVRPDLFVQAQQVVALLVLGCMVAMGTQVFSAILVAHQQIHIDNVLQLVTLALRTFLAVLLLLWGWKLLAVVLANLISKLVVAGLAVARSFYSIPGLRIRWRLASKDTCFSLGKLGIWFSLGGLAIIFIHGSDLAVTARVVSLAQVTTLALTSRLFSLASSFLDPLAYTASPGLGQLLGKGDFHNAYHTYLRLLKLSMGGGLALAFALGAANGVFVPWWVGPQNYGGVWLDVAMGLNVLVVTWLLPQRVTLSAALIVRPQTLSGLAEGALNLGLSIFLGLHFGVVGVVAGTGLAALLTSAWYVPRLIARLFPQFSLKLPLKNLVAVLLGGIVLFMVSWGARMMGTRIGGPAGALLAFFITFLSGAAFAWWLIFDGAVRDKLRETLSGALIQFTILVKTARNRSS